MSYIEGFIAAVPRANKEAYRQHADGRASVFQETRRDTHGGELGRRRTRRQGHRLQAIGKSQARRRCHLFVARISRQGHPRQR